MLNVSKKNNKGISSPQTPPSAQDLIHITNKSDDDESYGMKELQNGYERRRVRRKIVNPPKRPYIHTIHLLKRRDELGLELAGGKASKYGDVGVYVTAIIDGSNAQKDGRIRKGDEILAINKRELRDLTIHQVRDLLIHCDNVVRLKIASKYPKKEECSTDSVNTQEKEMERPESPNLVFDLTLRKDAWGRGFGFTIMDGSDFGKTGIFVKTVFASGVAAKDGTLQRGDEIVSIEGVEVRHLPYDMAMLSIKNTEQGPVKFRIKRRRLSRQYTTSESSSSMEPNALNRTYSIDARFQRNRSDRSIQRGQPLYSRNRKPGNLNLPIIEDWKPVRNIHLPMTSSVSRLQRHQSTESTDSCSSLDSCTSAPLSRNKTNSPIPMMGVTMRKRNHERDDQMALQRRSQSENDLRLMGLTIEDHGRRNGHSNEKVDQPYSMPYYANQPRIAYKRQYSPLVYNDYEDCLKRDFTFSPINEGPVSLPAYVSQNDSTDESVTKTTTEQHDRTATENTEQETTEEAALSRREKSEKAAYGNYELTSSNLNSNTSGIDHFKRQTLPPWTETRQSSGLQITHFDCSPIVDGGHTNSQAVHPQQTHKTKIPPSLDYEEPITHRSPAEYKKRSDANVAANLAGSSMRNSTRLNRHRQDLNLPGPLPSNEVDDVRQRPDVRNPIFPLTTSARYEYV